MTKCKVMSTKSDSLSDDQIDAVLEHAKRRVYKAHKIEGDPPFVRRAAMEAIAWMCYCEGYRWGCADSKSGFGLSKAGDK
jgi:hypothetical protein